MRTSYSESFKTAITKSYGKGESVIGISTRYIVPKSTIYYWIKMNSKLNVLHPKSWTFGVQYIFLTFGAEGLRNNKATHPRAIHELLTFKDNRDVLKNISQ